MDLVGGGSFINRASTFSSNIRVGCYGRSGEGSEALPAYNTGLAPAPANAPATTLAPAPVHNTILKRC